MNFFNGEKYRSTKKVQSTAFKRDNPSSSRSFGPNLRLRGKPKVLRHGVSQKAYDCIAGGEPRDFVHMHALIEHLHQIHAVPWQHTYT